VDVQSRLCFRTRWLGDDFNPQDASLWQLANISSTTLFWRPYSGSTTVVLCWMLKRLRLCRMSGDRVSLLGRKNIHPHVRGASLHDAALCLQGSSFADAPGWHERHERG